VSGVREEHRGHKCLRRRASSGSLTVELVVLTPVIALFLLVALVSVGTRWLVSRLWGVPVQRLMLLL